MLSEIQNGIFYISPRQIEFTAKTSKTDRFVDQDQARDFMLTSVTTPFVPADQNYPFSLIDNQALDLDLVILYKYDSIACCPYPAKAYLSRNNISIADYTNQKSPPPLFFNVISGRDPFHNEKVKTVYWKLTNYELTKNESIHENDSGIGYVLDDYVKVISGCVSVWISETHPICKEPAPRKTCLPERPRPKIVLIRYSSENRCVGEPYLPEPPKRSCISKAPPPERTTPAATNWSYNYNNNFFKDTDSSRKYNSKPAPKSEEPETPYHCPVCK